MSRDLARVMMGVLELHRLSLLDQNDSEEADEIRDKLNPELCLTREEVELCQEVSAKLNTIEEEVKEHYT